MVEFTGKGIVASLVAGFVILAGSAIAVPDVQAQQKVPAAKIAVVDVTFILNSSETWKNAENDMKARVGDVQKEIDKKRDALKTRADELKRQQTILAPDVFEQKARAIQKEQAVLQREAQVSNAKIGNVLNKMRVQLSGVITQLASKVAQEKGMNIGFDRSNIIFFDKGMDITQEVLKRFNASKTKVEFTVDKKQ